MVWDQFRTEPYQIFGTFYQQFNTYFETIKDDSLLKNTCQDLGVILLKDVALVEEHRATGM